jgi:hypothetical protein
MTNPSVTSSADRGHLLNSVRAPRMAKVHAASHGNPASWAVIGECFDEVRQDARLNVDEFAAALKRDPKQVGKWLKGIERPQFETVFDVEQFRQPLLLALARRVPTIQIAVHLTARIA